MRFWVNRTMNEEEDSGIDLSAALAVQLDGSYARPHHFPF
jgi:hypothetical protein